MFFSTKRKNVAIALMLSVAACLCLFCACKKEAPSSVESVKTTLDAPAGIKIENETLSWEAVQNADGYVVSVDGTRYKATENRFDLFASFNQSKTYKIKVMALSADGKGDSEWSETTEYTAENAEGWELLAIDNTGYEIRATDPQKLIGKLMIPSAAADGKPVTRIAKSGFTGCTQLTGAVIPASVTTVEPYAFSSCTALKRVFYAPSASSQTIEAQAFQNCSALTTVTLPSSLSGLGDKAFYDCTALKEIEIPSGTKTVGVAVFGYCDALTSLTVSEKNTVLRADGNCIVRKSNDTLIAGCTASAIPDYVKTIEKDAFAECRGMTEFTVPGNVKTVKGGAFVRCFDLKKVTFAEGVGVIGDKNSDGGNHVFSMCPQLETLEMPASLQYVTCKLTDSVKGLTNLTVKAGGSVYKSEGNCILRIEDNELVAGCQTSVVPAGTASIGRYAFAKAQLTEIVLPEGVEKIDAYAFYGSSLEKIVLPGSLKTIEAHAFELCLKLNEINLPYGLTSIGDNAFCDCRALRYATIPESVTTIGQNAFFDCRRLSVVLPGSVETIGKGAFCDYTTVYTSLSSESEIPDGWYRTTVTAALSGDYDWAYNCVVVYGCRFGYDEENPYVLSLTIVYTWDFSDSVGEFLPYREGYTFAGWATDEESGTVVYGVEQRETLGIYPEPYYVTLTRAQKETIPAGTVLYAVWIANE